MGGDDTGFPCDVATLDGIAEGETFDVGAGSGEIAQVFLGDGRHLDNGRLALGTGDGWVDVDPKTSLNS